MKKIVLFGVSANPPTGLGGHQGIVRSLVSQEKYDEVWVLPVFNHIYSSKRSLLLPFFHRVNMCQLCFERESNDRCIVKVSTIEEEVSKVFAESCHAGDCRVGTIDILDHLFKNNHDVEFYLAVGLDSFLDLKNRKWKESDRLLATVKLIVYQRSGYNVEGHALEDNVEFLTVPSLSNISSSAVREKILNGNLAFLDTEDVMCKGVKDYLLAHSLFV
eukprot:gene26058-31464_t